MPADRMWNVPIVLSADCRYETLLQFFSSTGKERLPPALRAPAPAASARLGWFSVIRTAVHSSLSQRRSSAATTYEIYLRMGLSNRASAFPQRPHSLMGIVDQHPLVVGQVCEKSKTPNAIGCDPVTVDDDGTTQELSQIVPVEGPAILEFLHQTRRIESIPRLPEFQHDKAADERLIERPRGKHAEIVDVARLIALIAGAYFLGQNFGQRQACDFRRRERQNPEIALVHLWSALCRQRWRFAPTDLQLDCAVTTHVPVMSIGGIDAHDSVSAVS